MQHVYTVDELKVEHSTEGHLTISTTGTTRSAGWEHPRLEPRVYTGGTPADGVLDFDFLAEPPEFGAEVISPVATTYVMETVPGWLKGVRIHSETNKKEASV